MSANCFETPLVLHLLIWSCARLLFPCSRVYQLTLLEVDPNGTVDTPSGVVLALVGSCREDECSSRGVESTKSLRMYSLSSIISLAKWAASGQVSSSPPSYR